MAAEEEGAHVSVAGVTIDGKAGGKGKQKPKLRGLVGGMMVVSRQFTSCTYQDSVIFLLSPLKPSEEKFKE